MGIGHHAGEGNVAASQIGIVNEAAQVYFPWECGVHADNGSPLGCFGYQGIKVSGQLRADLLALARTRFGRKSGARFLRWGPKAAADLRGGFVAGCGGMFAIGVHTAHCTPGEHGGGNMLVNVRLVGAIGKTC